MHVSIERPTRACSGPRIVVDAIMNKLGTMINEIEMRRAIKNAGGKRSSTPEPFP